MSNHNIHDYISQSSDNEYSFHLILFSDTDDDIYDLWLPGVAEGYFHFTDYPKHRFLSIVSREGHWYAECKKPAFFRNVPLEYSYTSPLADGQLLEIDYEDKMYSLYVEKLSRQQMVFHNYHIGTDVRISIGSRMGNDICYDNPYISDRYAVLSRYDGRWEIQDYSDTYGVYVNGTKVRQDYLKTGDVINIMGMKIIIGPGYLSINNEEKVTVNERILQEPTLRHSGYSHYYTQEVTAKEDSFFNRLPRKRLEITPKTISIEGPPMSMNQQQMPLMLRMGRSMAMGGAAALAGNFMTLITSVMFPFLSSKYTEKQRQDYEHLRFTKYTEYLNNKSLEIKEACSEEHKHLNEKYPVIRDVVDLVQQNVHVWERRPVDNDFLHIRLGTGKQPLMTKIDYPDRRFELESDDLEDKMYTLAEKEYYVEDVPITLSLSETTVCSLSGERKQIMDFVRQLVLQIAALHSYDEVKMVFLLNGAELSYMDDIRYLPHAWDDQRKLRFIATNEAEAYKLGEYINDQFFEDGLERTERTSKNRPYYLVFALDKKLFESHESFKKILQSDQNVGVSIVTAHSDLPKEAQKIISLGVDRKNIVTTMSADGGDDVFFRIDECNQQDIHSAMKVLANNRLKTVTEAQEIPKMLSFMEMFKAGRIEQLNPLKRWKENNPVKSLAAPVGVGADGSLFMLDLHEKHQGPHGLIAGMTGSGKSEFIITYILSMAVNYHPDEVAFVLIDYKGGGLAGAFENPQTGIRLPHLVGTITNLDGASINRSLMSIESELIRRQKIFNEVKSTVNEGTMDIYTYQKLYRSGLVSEPMPHLFIISDEFAELKQQQPEFMDKLISVARIGRSLGIHLVLATQKPSGVVNDQIRSNTKFRVCLRVQDRSDSMDMLKRPEAAELTDTGRFYLQVGYNEFFALGQSAWCGAPYEPQDVVSTKRDDSVEFLDVTGQLIGKAVPKVKKTDSGMKQIVAVVRYLAELAEMHNINSRQLWTPELPKVINYGEFMQEHSDQNSGSLSVSLGMIDDPEQQTQFPLNVDFERSGNILIAGENGSGKTTLVQNILYST